MPITPICKLNLKAHFCIPVVKYDVSLNGILTPICSREDDLLSCHYTSKLDLYDLCHLCATM